MPIYAKIQKVMQAVKGVEKGEVNRHANYKYAGHEAVTAALRDHFAELGIVRHASATDCEVLQGGAVKLTVRVSYVDVEDDTRIDLEMPAIQPSQTKAKEVTAQQIGQAVSYAVKNIEFKLFSLTGDTEADADALHVDHRSPPPNWDHPSQRGGNRTAQAADHERAAAIEDVMVIYNDDEQEGAATATEGAKMLAARMKKGGYFEAATMFQRNVSWIMQLPKNWSERLESIVNDKQAAEAGQAKDRFGGQAA